MLKNFPFRAIVLLALPASGKTTLVKSLRRDYGDGIAIDLDYRGSKKISDKVRALHTQLVNARIEEGCKVITTFDNWIDPMGLCSDVLCVYCLPKDVSVLTNRSRARGDSSAFSAEYSKNAKSWLEKWINHSNVYRKVDPSVRSSLVIKATIDFTKPWSYYLDSWFYDFVTSVKDFLGENPEACGDDDISIEIEKHVKARAFLKKASGLDDCDLDRLQALRVIRMIESIAKGINLEDALRDPSPFERRSCIATFLKTGNGFGQPEKLNKDGLRFRDEIDDVPGGDDYCGSSEC